MEALRDAAENEWRIGMGNLSNKYIPLFKIPLKTKEKKIVALKSWFVIVRKTKKMFEDPNLIHDQFSEKGPPRK